MSDEAETVTTSKKSGEHLIDSNYLFSKPFRPPDCCFNCKHMESEHSDIDGKLVFMCCMNLRFPTKKLTCKRQEPNNKISGLVAAERGLK